MKGISDLGLFLCKEFATSSFPVPDSPKIITVAFVCDSLPIERNTICIEAAEPMMSVLLTFLLGRASDFDTALFKTERTSSKSKGFGRYSKAPAP